MELTFVHLVVVRWQSLQCELLSMNARDFVCVQCSGLKYFLLQYESVTPFGLPFTVYTTSPRFSLAEQPRLLA